MKPQLPVARLKPGLGSPDSILMVEHDETPVYKFERRRADRWPARGVAVAHLTSGERFGERCTLRLQDESVDGLGATADRPVPPGTPITLGFADPGHPMLNGVVVRCLPCGAGYRMAIRFETRLAA